ncbi:MAG: ribosome silencing factor [Chitinispirillales bacterium]|jgi:ribosome-associated protein|nr:ribosome silencing factor [Chitinispirillales bacterium]
MNIEENEEIGALVKFLKEAKAEDITIIKTDVEKTETDFVVICKGAVFVHVSAIAQSVKAQFKKELGVSPIIFEGREHGRWILLHYSFATIHVMLQELRDYYKIEEIYKDCERLDIE